MTQVSITPFQIGDQHKLCPYDHAQSRTCVVCRHLVSAHASGILEGRKIEADDHVPDPSLEMARKYPKYFKELPHNWEAIDTYRIAKLFPVEDDSGMILHARKKLLVPGVRTGGKTMRHDIIEARDTLNRWLEDNQ